MKRIDLHIHTYATASDAGFDFDLEVLKEYVGAARLDAIAITNHNCFYRDNYDEIRSALDIPVFPGAELNVTTQGGFGHVLVIANPDDVDEFASNMSCLSAECQGAKNHVAWARVAKLLPKIRDWIVIPHYRKSKKIDSLTLNTMESLTGFDALEVTNAKKWLAEEGSAPKPLVIFSDCRPGLRMPEEGPDDSARRYAYGFTYLQCAEMNFPSVKAALRNPRNVSVFQEERDFEVLPEALPVSRRMNVILGKRSSGKSFTLRRIMDSFDPEDCLYIEQFEISNRAKKINFDNEVDDNDRGFFNDYFRELQDAMNDYFVIDPAPLEDAVKSYCSAVTRYANSPVDKYSERPIYNSVEYSFEGADAIERKDVELRKAARLLANGGSRGELIREYLDPASLLGLDDALRNVMKEGRSDRWQRTKCWDAIKEIKVDLAKKTSRKPLPEMQPLRDYFKYCYREYRLGKLLDDLAKTKDLVDEPEYKYAKKRTRQAITGAKQARECFKGRGTIPTGTDIPGLFSRGVDSARRLGLLRGFDQAVRCQACSLLFKIDSRIVLKKDGSPLSGGQRAEYLLLHLIDECAGKDVVLLDEPESSFDNPFLNSDVISMLNDVAEQSTVFLVTHNNTLGVSLLPDCVIYTEKTEQGEYRVYSGELSATKLHDVYGHERNRADVLLETMEAGRPAYLERRTHYGITEG